ncbi:MAG: hypothetical protein DMF06_04985 [Verrucomicrobia bacterium]|nr:MAG: hypothetical protein DMF06_04985 [Verrucomicrobiota bacterium]
MKSLVLSEADARLLAKALAAQWAQARVRQASDRPGTIGHPFNAVRTRAEKYRKDNAAKAKLFGKVLVQLGYALPEPNVEFFAPPLTEAQRAADYYKGMKWSYVSGRSVNEQARMIKEMGL